MVLTAITTLVTAFVLAVLLHALGITSMSRGALAGLGLGVGIVATSMLSDYLFCNWSIKLFLIQAGHRIAYLAVMGAILGAWH